MAMEDGAPAPRAERGAPVGAMAPQAASGAPATAEPATEGPSSARGESADEVRDRLLRERLHVALLGRLSIATVFLAAVLASRVFAHIFDAPIHSGETLIGATCAVAIALVSVWWAARVRRIELFAQVQSVLDVVLVAGAIAAVWNGVPGSAALLFFIPIANAAGLLLQRGALMTAAAASGAYFGLLARAVMTDPEGTWAATVAFPALGSSVMFFAGALMVGGLARRVAEAEEALARSGEEVERLEGVQRALANDLECGLLIADVSGRVRSANPAAQQILGLSMAAALGREVNWLIPTLTTAEQERALDTPPGGEIGFVECDLRAADGSARRLRVKRTPLADTYGNPAGELVLLQDMTRILELEERLSHGDELGLVLSEGDGADASEPGEGVEDGMIGTCPAMRTVAKLVAKVAQTDATVLVTGESGTGKELVARAIHRRSGRAGGPFVVVNCGAIPENLIESELFGHVKGSFTGAIADRPGLFRRAHGGTIFLDEIGELPLNLQVRLLRVLQDHTVMPVGGNSQIPVDVRVVAATNRVLEDLVKAGEYREDLYYRLAVISIPLPPLRERGTRDLEKLIAHFVRRAAERHAKSVGGVSARAMHLLLRYPYPGNVRELENVIEHATTLCEADTIRESDLPESVRESGRVRPVGTAAVIGRDAMGMPPGADGMADAAAAVESWSASPIPGAGGSDEDLGAVLLPIDEGEGLSLDDQLERREKAMLLAALARAEGVKKRAATLLGINYRSFRHRLQKYGLDTQDADVIPRFEPSLPRERSH